ICALSSTLAVAVLLIRFKATEAPTPTSPEVVADAMARAVPLELLTAVSERSPPDRVTVAPCPMSAMLSLVVTMLRARDTATVTPLGEPAPERDVAPKVLVPLPVMVADRFSPLALIAAFWPMVASLVELTTLIATAAPTAVPLPLTTALPLAAALALVSLL